jgi:tetratricopeptide (TPR) repeat protein
MASRRVAETMSVMAPAASHGTIVLHPYVGVAGDKVDPDYANRVAAAERSLEAGSYKAVVEELSDLRLTRCDSVALALRAAVAEAAALLELGEVDAATNVLEGAQPLADNAETTDHDRATVLFQLGCARLAAGAVAEAAASLTLALDLCNRSPQPSDSLRALVLERRARCHRHNRDWPAARSDVERALELAESLGDDGVIAQACLQASVVAEREGQWILAQFYAERARETFVQLGDVFGVGKCLNNLGGLAFLLGDADGSRKLLQDSFRILLDLGRDVEASYALSSLAQVELRSGDFETAERLACRALVFLGSRTDHRTEHGNAQIVLGRAVLEQGRVEEAEEIFAQAERTLDRAAPGERAAVWLAQGDAAARRGSLEESAERYRRAAEALQDFHF